MPLYVLAIVVVLAFCLYMALLAWFVVKIAPLLLLGGAAAAGLAILVSYLWALGETLLWGTGFEDSPTGDQPAFRQYFFRKVFHDFVLVVRRAHELNVGLVTWIFQTAAGLFRQDNKIVLLFTWPLGVIVGGIGAVSLVPALACYVSFGLVHLAAAVASCTLALVGALLARALEHGAMAIRQVFVVCTSCHKRVGLALYRCPKCNAEHTRLLPGSYGTLARRCACGKKLPTLFCLGRHKLASFCPHEGCGVPIREIVCARNLHFPVAGGASAGKSSFLTACMVELCGMAEASQLTLDFPDQKNERLFAQSKLAFARGDALLKTQELVPDAFRVQITTGRRAHLLYAYDPAGEAYQESSKLSAHNYYGYAHGGLFLIDPFSLRQVQQNLGERLSSELGALKPSAEPPEDVYMRLIATLRQHSGKASGRIDKPFAVVLTKSDAMGIGENLAQREQLAREETDARGRAVDAASAAVRAFLFENGESNLVKAIEGDFARVRFFSCSALGRAPDSSGRPFSPQRAFEPLAWALEAYGIRDYRLAKPGDARPPKAAKIDSQPSDADGSLDGVPRDVRVMQWSVSALVVAAWGVAAWQFIVLGGVGRLLR